jgi:two-component sensor histidine kinase
VSNRGDATSFERTEMTKHSAHSTFDLSDTPRFDEGLGTRLTDALAAELNGVLKRRFSESGATVTLAFSIEAANSGLLDDGYNLSQETRQ